MLSLSYARLHLTLGCDQLQLFPFRDAMTRVKNSAHLRDDVLEQEDEGAAVERGLSDGDEGNNGSTEGTWSVHMSNAGSQSNADDNSTRGLLKYSFSPSTMIVSQIHELVEQGCFDEGSAHAPREEMILKLEDDVAVMFEEFFTIGLRMPLHY
jgi:hypothetical protein